MTYRAFVVDDEPLARTNLIDALSASQPWSSITAFSSGDTLLEQVIQQRPDVVFLDIQMPAPNGLTLAKQIQSLELPPLIVFVTAFSDYAVQAFELYALDYLLKPFDDTRVQQCVDKINRSLSNHGLLEETRAAQQAWANTAPLEKLIIKSSQSIRIIPVEQIDWLAANGNYVDIYHREGKHLLRGSLKSLLSYLSAAHFVQIHRGYAVRQLLIREVITLDEERSEVVLAQGNHLPVGRSFKKVLIERLCGKSDIAK